MPYQPVSMATGAVVAHRLQKTLAEFPPPIARDLGSLLLEGAQPLGSYLINLGYLTREQLNSALTDQRWSHEMCMDIRLGDILLQRGIMHEQVLAMALLMQSMDRLLDQHGPLPHFIGEHLLLERSITVEQLATALQVQNRLVRHGKRVQLGDLLLTLGSIDRRQLDRALIAQQQNRTRWAAVAANGDNMNHATPVIADLC